MSALTRALVDKDKVLKLINRMYDNDKLTHSQIELVYEFVTKYGRRTSQTHETRHPLFFGDSAYSVGDTVTIDKQNGVTYMGLFAYKTSMYKYIKLYDHAGILSYYKYECIS